ncbi:cell division protein ZapA [[Haemophilus] felis]|uniref:Cell division protein ZapA n=1 Tax=[Haemophilus] felis TaxID=123822 RepID=A0A1T0B2I6_9PAST|nr:cell division protein ZapA [[Haemophilus] felis]NBI40255.1 cell division protein ZapA [[Haemophilus] felis]NBI42498.1 cell division protein ZapA [[Haemophilus] felis]OOS04335.1 cell division protein ZapA [[Haemophilus] felis]
MSNKAIEVSVLGQLLRLNCPEAQHEVLRQSAKQLDQRVSEMRDRSGILQLERVLAIVALNLCFELEQEKQKNTSIENELKSHLAQLDHSLESLLTQKLSN